MEKKIILIADDDELSRVVIHKYMSDYYDVLEAEDGEQALQILHERPVDILILDIVMPKVTGFEVLQHVKCEEKYRDLRVLVATSMQEKTERRALELGADDIVFKPYDPVVIKKRMDNLMSMQDQKRELEKALARAEKANHAKTDFLSRISHDMRTPLNGILGLTGLMRERVYDSQTKHDLAQLEMSGRYLLHLINDTLDVNKIESGKLELHPEVCSGREVLNNVVRLITPSMQEKNIHFNVNVDGLPFGRIFVDAGRLEQVAMNILSNAVKFTPENGTIDATMLNLSNDGQVIRDRIIVHDSGVGMSKEFLPHLFEPFTQENPGTTGNTTGTGLGMTITKQIIDLMDGTIQVESEPGEGTTFTIDISLPIATEEQISAWKDVGTRNVADVDFAGKRVLLCEDHPLNAEIAVRLLSKKGIEVEKAENGKIGLEKFKHSARDYYDMILMDIRMPVMDGLEAAREIRALQREDAHTIPIVSMSANALDEDLMQAKEAGIDGYLTKPINVEKLYQCLAGMMHMQYQHLKKEILIVDDIELNREAIRLALAAEYKTYEAANGSEALKVLEEHESIDLVITDIQMPVMNGMKLIEKIRAVPKYNRVAIIANTQFGDPEQEEKILSLGANDFVYKPTTPKIVVLRVRNILDRV